MENLSWPENGLNMVGKKGLQGEPPGKHLPADSWLSWYANNPFCIKIDSTSKAVMLEKTLESPLDFKKIKPINPKGNQPWIFLGRTDAEAETPILWPPDWKSWLIGKKPDSGKDWRQEEKEMTEDDMVGWHHWLDGHEFEFTPGVHNGQGGLAYCSPWGCKELDMTEPLKNTPTTSKALENTVFS